MHCSLRSASNGSCERRTGLTDRGGKPATAPAPTCWLGVKAGGDLRLQYVYRGGPAERAGLAAHDVLVAIDGVKASADAVAALQLKRVPRERVKIHAFRRDELIEVDVELAGAPLDTCYLALRPHVPADVLALRNAWLGG